MTLANTSEATDNSINLHEFTQHASCNRDDLVVIFDSILDTMQNAGMPEAAYLQAQNAEAHEICLLLIMEVLTVGTFIVSAPKDMILIFKDLMPVKKNVALQALKKEALSVTLPEINGQNVSKQLVDARQKAYLDI